MLWEVWVVGGQMQPGSPATAPFFLQKIETKFCAVHHRLPGQVADSSVPGGCTVWQRSN
jgi:hypothetical protein